MDQDSFRRLLQGSKANGSSTVTLGSNFSSRAKLTEPSKQKVVKAVPQASFKPRKVQELKDLDLKQGTANAHVDDSDSLKVSEPPPTKGLDFALLEQAKAKAAQLTNDDMDELEQAFAESSSKHAQVEQVVTKKRTREEIIRELKQKRAANGGQVSKLDREEPNTLEEAKQKGKFKPIGAKHTGSSSAGHKRKEIGEGENKKKKKKRKTEEREKTAPQAAPSTIETAPAPAEQKFPEPEDVDDDFDIFADAGDYTGVEIDEDEDEDARKSPADNGFAEAVETASTSVARWIAIDDEPPSVPVLPNKPPLYLQPPPSIPPSESKEEVVDSDKEEPMRLAPLESSAVPSIRDLLAMDDAAIKYEKKQKRKEKKRKRGSNVKGLGSDDD